jgi:hypothetical protein
VQINNNILSLKQDSNIILINTISLVKESIMAKENGPSGLSIAALVTGILGMSVIPIILGAIDLNRIKNGAASPRGRGLDIAGIVLGAIAIVVWLIVSIVSVIAGLGTFF